MAAAVQTTLQRSAQLLGQNLGAMQALASGPELLGSGREQICMSRSMKGCSSWDVVQAVPPSHCNLLPRSPHSIEPHPHHSPPYLQGEVQAVLPS